MQPYLKLVRIPNLVFIAFIQFVMRQAVIIPILQMFGFDATIPTDGLWLLIAATVLIAAGGYVLNDYFDIKIDQINRPDQLIITRTVSKKQAMTFYQILTGLGLLSGLTLSIWTKSFTLGFMFVVITGLLWFYSASYKRQLIVGNVIVAFMAAMTVLIVAINEMAFLELSYGKLVFETPIPSHIYAWVGSFAIFSFLTTWIREIIKDMQDEAGDRELECRTMPIKWGIMKTKIFIYSLIAITIALLYLLSLIFVPFTGHLTSQYISYGIVLPLIVLIYLVSKASSATEYAQASTLLKFTMLIGVFYSFIFYYLQAKSYGISIFNLFMVK